MMTDSATQRSDVPEVEPTAAWTARIFGISWLSYFSYYFARKNFAAAKSSTGLAAGTLQWIDFSFLVGYMVGMFGNGALGELIGPRLLVTIGMLSSAVVTVAFAMADSVTTQFVIAYFVLSVVNGLAQSTGWPGNARLTASWFSTARRGQIMGMWSTCYQAGGVAATMLAGFLLKLGTWRVMYLCMATWVAMVGGLYWTLVRNRPSDVGYHNPDGVGAIKDPHSIENQHQRAVARALLFRNPMTYAFGACYFALKLMRYGFLFWLPYYLTTSLPFTASEAAFMSIAFDLGGIPFSILAGWIADKLLGRRRVLVAFVASVLLFGALYLYREFASAGPTANFFLLMQIGACLFAADTLVSGAAAQDLGGPRAAGLACGVINGIGSIGAIVQSLTLVGLKERYGWDGVFALFQWMAVLAALVLLPFVATRPKLPPSTSQQ
jgi:sugar phosphate permease